MIVSCLKPPGPLPLPLSPTVAKVFWFNLPLVTKFCVCVLSVPVWNLKVGIFHSNFISYPVHSTYQFIQTTFYCIYHSSNVAFDTPNNILSPLFILLNVLRTLFHKPLAIFTVVFLILRQVLDMKLLTRLKILRVPL